MNLLEIKTNAVNEYNIIFADLIMLSGIDLNILQEIISNPKESLCNHKDIPYKNKILTLTHLMNNHKLREHYKLLSSNKMNNNISKLIIDYLELKYNIGLNSDKYYLKYIKYKQKYLELKAIKNSQN